MRWPDFFVDDKAMDITVIEDVVLGPIRDDPVRHEPILVVEDPPANFESSLPEVDLGFDDDVACAKQSLGSMGVREDSDESNDDNQVIPFKLYPSVQYMALFENEVCLIERIFCMEPTVMSSCCGVFYSGERHICQ